MPLRAPATNNLTHITHNPPRCGCSSKFPATDQTGHRKAGGGGYYVSFSGCGYSVRRSRCVSRSAESRQQPHRPTGVHRRVGGQQSGRRVRMGVQVPCVVCVCGVRVWCVV